MTPITLSDGRALADQLRHIAALGGLTNLVRVIRESTQTIPEHDDPGSVTDCWNTLAELAEDVDVSLAMILAAEKKGAEQ